MAETRKGEVTFKGNPITLVGPKLKPGDKAPDFTCRGGGAGDGVAGRYRRQGPPLQRRPLARHPRLQQADQAVRRGAQGPGRQGGRLHRQPDLPFAQARFCTEANIENIKNLSDAHNHSFGEHYGVLISDLPMPLLARAVFVVDAVEHDPLCRDRARDRPGAQLRAGPQSTEGSRRADDFGRRAADGAVERAARGDGPEAARDDVRRPLQRPGQPMDGRRPSITSCPRRGSPPMRSAADAVVIRAA